MTLNLGLHFTTKPTRSQYLNGNSPYYLPHISHKFCSENFVLEQMIIPLLMFSYILLTRILDFVEEILSRLLMEVKLLTTTT